MGKKTSSSLCKVRKTFVLDDNVTMWQCCTTQSGLLSSSLNYPFTQFLSSSTCWPWGKATSPQPNSEEAYFLGQSLQNIGQIGFSSGKYFNENNRNEIFLIQVWWKATVVVCVCVGSILSLWSVVIVKRPCRAFLSYCQYTPAPHLVYQHHTHEHDE